MYIHCVLFRFYLKTQKLSSEVTGSHKKIKYGDQRTTLVGSSFLSFLGLSDTSRLDTRARDRRRRMSKTCEIAKLALAQWISYRNKMFPFSLHSPNQITTLFLLMMASEQRTREKRTVGGEKIRSTHDYSSKAKPLLKKNNSMPIRNPMCSVSMLLSNLFRF